MQRELTLHKVNAFLAAVDLKAGQEWTEVVWRELARSSWVVFLASKAACQSSYVQQELGMALRDKKTILPVLWNIDPSELPDWMIRFQALDLRGATLEDLRRRVATIASQIKADKNQGLVIAGAIFVGLLLLAAAD